MTLLHRKLGLVDYEDSWQRMKSFTQSRDDSAVDEVWSLEHPPLFTQGQAGKEEHLLMPGDIPVIQTDRGGQVTYHGPGQLIVYVMVNLKRAGIGVRDLVSTLENAIVKTLSSYQIEAYAKADAPGVYVDEKKIASLGLRIRRGCSFHGLALNVDMDLAPFERINPCGYQGLQMINMATLNSEVSFNEVETKLVGELAELLGYPTQIIQQGWN